MKSNLWLVVGTLTLLAACAPPIFEPEDTMKAPNSPAEAVAGSIIADHRVANLSGTPKEYVQRATTALTVAYGHTSHGSQIVDGLAGLMAAVGPPYEMRAVRGSQGLRLLDNPFEGASDLGSPDRTSWAGATRRYLKQHPEVNVVMWSWCGQVSSATPAEIDRYLHDMTALEAEYPRVRFVYMTGHLDGTGLQGNLHQRNEQIRAYCRSNGKVLFDFADIERFDPDGNDYGARNATDACDYDSNGDGTPDRNWAQDWQQAHPGKWYPCNTAHSQPLNGNRKAYAAWWLFARLSGWDGK